MCVTTYILHHRDYEHGGLITEIRSTLLPADLWTHCVCHNLSWLVPDHKQGEYTARDRNRDMDAQWVPILTELRRRFKAFYGASRRIPHQAFQLVTAMGWYVSVGVQRKPVDTGTVGARACGKFICIAEPRPNTPHLLSGPRPKGHALLHGGSHGAGEFGLVVEQGSIA